MDLPRGDDKESEGGGGGKVMDTHAEEVERLRENVEVAFNKKIV